jgi:hypothetical protein
MVYDRPEEAAWTIQILEYAKMQLLEFRYYDNYMTRVLSDVYNTLDRKQSVLLRPWALPREANRLNAIRLDVMELTERIDSAVKSGVSPGRFPRGRARVSRPRRK